MLNLFLSLAAHMVYLFLGISNAQNFPPPLPAKEERQLFLKMKQGDQDARASLIEHNLRLVAHMVRKYYASCENQDELISVGSLGLMKAVDTFDCENGARFATYAAKCIQNEILMLFRSQKKLSCEISIHETIDVDRDGNPLTYMDVISTEDTTAEDLDLQLHAKHAKDLIQKLLTPKEREIILLRYGLCNDSPKTQREVAKMLGISRSYVSRIEKRALYKMRVHFGNAIPDFESFGR